ncbi:hypothetical protein [Rhizobium sophoriradicis]|uniref:Uncharacterized protein n=1 Tax=Rhizobium sophoriradicis TaxID=1535245 RepID=A0A2A5KL47_9HYPH|nr:hypothetical protein [Rhizobium sophoriradicis]PCK77671.1 hypothetical protein CPT34_28665 [Rhizobium sophoriradicis]
MVESLSWSTGWSQRTAARYSDLCAPEQIRKEPREALLSLLSRTLAGPKPDQLRAELIATKQQSASVITKRDEGVILFDVAQSMVLKRLFHLVASDQPYDAAAKVLSAAAGLAVADQHPALCSALLSLSVPEQAEYVHDEAALRQHYSVLKPVLEVLLTDWQSSIIDGFIFAHEISHFKLHEPDKLMLRVQAGARSAYEFALNEVCYERRPDFETIARHYGAIHIEPAELERIRADLANRRVHYDESREHLIEEITCDAYALTVLMSSHTRVWWPMEGDSNEKLSGFSRFAQTFFLVACLSDLHQAMIKRAHLSTATGIESEKPGHIADMHFRKIALFYTIAECAMTCVPDTDRNDRTFTEMLYQVKQVIGLQKQALDALVVIPITRVIKAGLIAFEQDAAQQQPVEAGECWQGRLAVLFGESLPKATFQNAALRTMLGGQ